LISTVSRPSSDVFPPNAPATLAPKPPDPERRGTGPGSPSCPDQPVAGIRHLPYRGVVCDRRRIGRTTIWRPSRQVVPARKVEAND
jgi:hypothetical protein